MSDTKSFSFRIDQETLYKLRVIANNNGHSLNNQINIYIQEHIKNFESEHGIIDLDNPPAQKKNGD